MMHDRMRQRTNHNTRHGKSPDVCCPVERREERKGPQRLGLLSLLACKLLALLACLGLGGTFWATEASAHASVSSTSPEAGSTLAASPTEVTITFDQGISVPTGGVRILNEQAQRIGVQKPRVGSKADRANTVSVAVPTLRGGAYVVSWRAVSGDGHPIRGAFTFRVGASGDQIAVAKLARELLTNGSTDPTLSLTMAMARVLSFASMLLLLGGVAYVLLIRPVAPGNDARVVNILTLATVIAGFSGLVSVVTFGPFVAGESFTGVSDGTLLDDTISSSIGRSMLLRTVALVALGFLTVRTVSALTSKGTDPNVNCAPDANQRAALVGLSAAVLVLSTFIGHGTTGRWRVLGATATGFHIAAASTWIGLLVLVLAATSGADRAKASQATKVNRTVTQVAQTTQNVLRSVERFSTVAFWSVAVLVLSGMLNGLRQIGSVRGLTTTNYGRLLLIKLGVVLLLIGLGWQSRRSLSQRRAAVEQRMATSTPHDPETPPDPLHQLDPSTQEPRSSKRLPPALVAIRRRMLVESLLATVVITVTALLVNSPPSIEVLGKPVSVTMHGTTFLLDTTVSPAQSGTNRLHFYALTPEGQTQTVEAMTVTASMPSSDIAPIDLNVVRAGSNHFQALQADLPVKGPWRFTVEVQLDTFTAESVAATIAIR